MEPQASPPADTPARAASAADSTSDWARDEARLWHVGWAVGAAIAAAALLIGLGALPAQALAGLAAGILPGVFVGLLQPREPRHVPWLLGLWAAAAAAAAGLTGGLGGPLALWCALPLVAAVVLEGDRVRLGAGLSFAAVGAVGLLQYLGRLPPSPPPPVSAALGTVGVLSLVAATGKALWPLVGRAREAEQERALVAGFAAELPCLALSLDRDGLVEAAYGAGLPGFGERALDAGLVAAALSEDRAALKATLWEAMDHGAAETVFRPAAAPEAPVVLSLRRHGEGSLSATLRPAPAAALAAAPAAPSPAPEIPPSPDAGLEGRLAAALAERDQAQASAQAKARFLANMSHELRTPLNAIMGFSDIMRSRLFGELSQRYGDYAELIHESGRHLLDLINDVLDMSKIEADRYVLALEDFDAREPVSAALRLVRLQADEAGIALRGVLPNEPLPVEADRRALKQTVLNLVSNALKFTPRGGQITVSLAAVDARTLELTVADTGVGIASEDLARLGQPYEQAGGADSRAMGTGIGLSLVKALAQLHGGSMTIESQVGEGTAVTVRLPVLTDEIEHAPQPVLPFEAEPLPSAPTFTAAPPQAPPEPPPPPQRPASGGAEVISLNLIRPFGGPSSGNEPGPSVA